MTPSYFSGMSKESNPDLGYYTPPTFHVNTLCKLFFNYLGRIGKSLYGLRQALKQ